MDNNNLNNVPTGTPTEPVTPVTPVQPEPVVAQTPVTPAVPVTPVTPTPVEPVAPVAPTTNPVPIQTPVLETQTMASPVPEFTPATNTVPPVQGLNNQVTPVTTPVNETPVTPVAPVTPEAPVAPTPQEPTLANVSAPQPVAGGYIPPVTPQPQEPKKKNNTVIIIVAIILVVAVLGVVALLTSNKDDDKKDKTTTTVTTSTTTENQDLTTTTTTQTTNSGILTTTTTTTSVIPPVNTTTVAPTPNVDNNLLWNQAQYNNVTISLPATKDSFNGTGWTWDSSYAEKTLKTGYTTSGGRIGKYPGGVVVSVVNMTGTDQLIKDCKIDSATFYNPKDGSEDVRFIGGIHYGMSADQVKAAMANKGYKNLDERTYDNSLYLKYQFHETRTTIDYIEFYFYKETMQSVTIDVDYTK